MPYLRRGRLSPPPFEQLPFRTLRHVPAYLPARQLASMRESPVATRGGHERMLDRDILWGRFGSFWKGVEATGEAP